MKMLDDRIARLEQTLSDLQRELEDQKQNQRPTNIEYKFDQLKVERLEGTLNIGLSPQNANEQIEDFQVQNQLNVSKRQECGPMFENIKGDIYHYLDFECLPVLESIEHKYNYPLRPEYRQFIVTDVKNQIDDRISHYLNQVNYDSLTKEQQQEVEYRTKAKVREDINKTFELFIQNLPKGSGGAHQ